MKGRILLPIIALPIWFFNGVAYAQADVESWGFNHMMNWGGGWGGMILGPVMMILMLVLVIVIAVAVLRWLGVTASSDGGAAGTESALDILERRYARGEIDANEFSERKSRLRD